MHPFRRILVVLDDVHRPSRALVRAVAIAGRHGARITAAYAFEDPGLAALPLLDATSAEEVRRLERDRHVGHLAECVAMLREDGTDVDLRLLIGIPFVEIVREVMRGDHDVVLKDARRQGGMRARMFNSLDLHLMRKCPVPLWMLTADSPGHATRIVAAVDPSQHEHEHNGLNHVILDLAASIARLEGGELHVVHAWRLFGESALRSSRSQLSTARVDALVEAERAERLDRLGALVRPYQRGDLRVETHLVRGDAPDVLPAAFRELRADLVVMGTVARTGIAGLIIGNTAETVLGDMTCPVLAAKPPGFVSPVEPASEDGAEPHRTPSWDAMPSAVGAALPGTEVSNA